MRRSAWYLLWALSVLSSCAAAGDATPFEYDASEGLAPENVVVIYKSVSAWRPNIEVSALSGDGRFRITGVYGDTTTIRGAVPPDSALTIVNELLALNFFELPARFDCRRYALALKSDGKLGVRCEQVYDAGLDTITLVIGRSRHEVSLAYPAHGAPESLQRWRRRFAAFMKECRGW